MDPKLIIAVANASLSFVDESRWRGSWKEAMSAVSVLEAAIESYEDTLSNEALEDELKGEAEAYLQKAREMLSQIREFILSKEDPEGD